MSSCFLFATQGKSLIANGICVGLLPRVLKKDDFHSKLLIILGGALVSQTLSYTLKGRLTVSFKGLCAQTVTQMILAYIFSPSTTSSIPPRLRKTEPRIALDYRQIKNENERWMSEDTGETLQRETKPFELIMDAVELEGSYHTEVEVLPMDCLSAAHKGVQKGFKTALVNFASTQEFGGGYTEGQKGSQEEEICYRSTIGALSMRQFFYPDEKMSLAITTEQLGNWNSDRPNKVLLTPDVNVFRDEKYQKIAPGFTVGILSCAALVRIGKDNVPYTEEEKTLMKALIRTQLHAAYENGYTAFVSGAFGCGKFGNPPKEVAALYSEILSEEFKGVFQYVAFAILPDAFDSSKDNFTPFQETFQINS